MANLYLGNLPREITESLLEEFLQEAQCPYESIKLIRDLETGQPRGFAFIELPASTEIQEAIQKLNGCVMNGRPLVVNEARPQKPKGSGQGGGRHSDSRPHGGGRGFGGGRGGGRDRY